MLPSLWLSPLFCATLALAAPTKRQNIPKVLITPDLFPSFNRYAHFASASYTYPCPTPPLNTTLAGYYSTFLTSTQAMLFRDDTSREFILAFPGTASFDDQLTDILAILLAPNLVFPQLVVGECEGCAVHLGVLLAWINILGPLRKLVDEQMDGYDDYRLTLTGHSLGGSIATLAYASLAHFGYNISAVYTFGQPRTGNPSFANHIDALSGATETTPGVFFRSTHGSDGVPQLPTQGFGYRHSRTEYWEDNGSATEGAGTTWRCYGQEPFDCNDSVGKATVLKGQGHGYYGGVYMGIKNVCGA